MADLELTINFNPDGWGPINGEKLGGYEEIPYAHFDKKEKVNKPADFVLAANGNLAYQRHPHYLKRRELEAMNAATTDFSYKYDAAEDSSFQLVDTSKTQTRTRIGGGRGRLGNRGRFGGRGLPTRTDASNAGSTLHNNGKMQKQGGRFARNNWGGRGSFQRRDRKMDRMPSLSIGGDWEMLEEFDVSQLLKLQANPPTVEDLVWAGHLDQYEDSYDALTTRTSRIVKRRDKKVFYDVTSSEDPILERLAVEEVGDVYATDTIIAQLMAAPRSVYSWDIIIQKVEGSIFLDKRDNSTFDFLTVSETALEPPIASDDMEPFNHPEKLSLEATMINQHFSQQVLKEKGERKSYDPNPFFDDEDDSGMEPASAAYRYRKFTLGNIKLVARCELQCWHQKKGIEKPQLMTCHAINEWDSKYSGGVNWRQKIDQQRGAVLANELKNNSCKFAKWTAQAILADAQQMKLGYISRVAPSNPYEHSILATQYFKPKDLANQINLSVNNIWGIVKMVCEMLMKKEDGKYVLMKDPNKAIVRLYSIPPDTFEDEDEDEEDEDEEDEEGEERENADEQNGAETADTSGAAAPDN